MDSPPRENENGAGSQSLDQDQYLTFTLADEEYGIDILRVQEIKGFAKVRPIPQSPPYVRGVLNLRGTVVPIVDLRVRLGMDEVEYNSFTVIIVVSVGDKIAGLVVDAVSDVLNIAAHQIDDVPQLQEIDESCLSGMGKLDDKFVLLLDIDKLISFEQLQPPNSVAA